MPRRGPIGSVPNIASDDPIDLRWYGGQPDPASERNLIHRSGDCLIVAKSVLPSLPICTGSWRAALLPAGGFSRRLRLDGKRVNGALEFRGKRRIYHAMALDPALPFEGR